MGRSGESTVSTRHRTGAPVRLAFAGPSGAGKDSLARATFDVLGRPARRLAFGDAIKLEVSRALDILARATPAEAGRAISSEFGLPPGAADQFVLIAAGRRPQEIAHDPSLLRHLCQCWGFDVWGRLDRQRWLRSLANAMLTLEIDQDAYIADCRLGSEVSFSRACGFVTVYVDTPEDTRRERLTSRDGGPPSEDAARHRTEIVDGLSAECDIVVTTVDEPRLVAAELLEYVAAARPRSVGATRPSLAHPCQQRLRVEQVRLRAEVSSASSAVLKGFLTPFESRQLADALTALPTEHERVETADGSWTIELIDNSYQDIDATPIRDPFSALTLSRPFLESLCAIVGVESDAVFTTRRWVNYYLLGDHITEHVDTTGDFSVLLCLEAPSMENGGALVHESGLTFHLAPGDLVVMSHADEVSHWTTALVGTDSTPAPRRVTAVCRYYIRGGREPRSRLGAHTLRGPVTEQSPRLLAGANSSL